MSMEQMLNDAKTLEKSYRAVLALVAKIQEIGDLDKAYEAAEKKLREHKQEVATAENKTQEAKDRLASVYDEVDRAKEKAADLVADAHKHAEEVLAIASHEVAEMNREAKEMVAKATAEVENFHTHVRDANEAHKVRMEKNDAEYAEVTESLSVLNTELSALRERIG